MPMARPVQTHLRSLDIKFTQRRDLVAG